MWHSLVIHSPRGGALPIMDYTGGAPPERGTFFRVGISRVQVYKRVRKTGI